MRRETERSCLGVNIEGRGGQGVRGKRTTKNVHGM